MNIEVAKGELLALLGHNGSGKSTLLRSIARLIEPSSGQIFYNGSEITKISGKSLRQFRSQVAFIFQKHNLVPRLSALSNVIHGSLSVSSNPRLWYQAIAPQEMRDKALACLEAVGLEFLALKRADQLSGGQAQRVAIARALMQDAPVIFADEPVASLDPKAATEVMELLSKLVRNSGKTLIFSTHHLDHAFGFADRLFALRQGEVLVDCKVGESDPDSIKNIYEQVGV